MPWVQLLIFSTYVEFYSTFGIFWSGLNYSRAFLHYYFFFLYHCIPFNDLIIMRRLKRIFKRNSHSFILKPLAGFGRAVNRLYENRNHDIYSNGELTVLKKIAKTRPSLIIDGGANVGNYSAMLSHVIPGCAIYAFEPVSLTFETLSANTKDNPLIKPVKKGLYRDTCSKEINLFPGDEHSSIYDIEGIPYRANSKETIELLRGDEFIEENKIGSVDLLKLDIEGAEYDALLGFENSLGKGIIKAVQFEYGYINITTKKLLIDYYHFFEKHGYRVGKIFPKVVEFRKYSFVHEDFLGPNFLAVKNTETELMDLLSKK